MSLQLDNPGPMEDEVNQIYSFGSPNVEIEIAEGISTILADENQKERGFHAMKANPSEKLLDRYV